MKRYIQGLIQDFGEDDISCTSSIGVDIPRSVLLRAADKAPDYDEDTFWQLVDNRCDELNNESAPVAYPKPDKPGFIYAVVVGQKIKLGRTVSLTSRFKSYERVCDNFRVIATKSVDSPVQAERDFLAQFDLIAGKSEWTNYSEQLESDICDWLKSL